MRTPIAVAVGFVTGIVATGFGFIAFDRSNTRTATSLSLAAPITATDAKPGSAVRDTESVTAAAPAASAPRSTAGISQPGTRSAARPVTPDYGSSREAARPIFRCRSRGATVYSNEACADGSVVDQAIAVSGYDTHPSDRMAQLVAEGRNAAAEPVRRGTVAAASERPSTETFDCANLRRQIRDIDNETLAPIGLHRLDELRATRQDIRTSMARMRC